MAGARPYAIGIRAVRIERETVSNDAGKQREVAAMKGTEQEFRDPSMSTKMLAPRLADFSVKTTEKLRFADTDRQGHITNTVFAVCCQNARMELLCDAQRVPIPPNTQFVIAKLVLEFRAEMHWPGTVEIGTRVERVGRSSATLAQALFVDGGCVATAESVVVLMDLATRRSALLPEETAEALRAIARPKWSKDQPRRLRWVSCADKNGRSDGTTQKLPNTAPSYDPATRHRWQWLIRRTIRVL